jgi:hypothetical protein
VAGAGGLELANVVATSPLKCRADFRRLRGIGARRLFADELQTAGTAPVTSNRGPNAPSGRKIIS